MYEQRSYYTFADREMSSRAPAKTNALAVLRGQTARDEDSSNASGKRHRSGGQGAPYSMERICCFGRAPMA